jgi:pyridoxamine 5'-phosphate oxidase family protein
VTTFTAAETAYLDDQRLGRIATSDPDGRPHVVPVGFRLRRDEGVIDVGGLDLTRSKKWRDLTRNPKVAFVVDDLATVDPWRPRGVEIRGRAELHEAGGDGIHRSFGAAWVRIVPERVVSWGLDTSPFAKAESRAVTADAG